jgi:choline transport protein
MWALTINGAFGFVMMVTYCFTLGDPGADLESPTGYPMIAAFLYATRSYAGTSVMIAVIIVNVTSSCISTLATVSRQTWSFARDGGLPFASFIGEVRPGWNIPLNAVCLTFIFTTLLSLINIGSTVAFNAICSMATNALLSTYIISIGCLLIRRVRGPALPPRRWSLGTLGFPINLLAVLFLTWIWVFCFFPQTTPVEAATMNWNIVINAFVMLFAVSYYFIKGRHTYVAPVVLVRRDL